MNINYENKIACLGFLEYLLYSLPLTGMDQITLYISQLNKILVLQEDAYTNHKLEQIFSFFSKQISSNSDICMASIQLIKKRIKELSEIHVDMIENIIQTRAKFQKASETIALEFKDCLAKEYHEPAVIIPHSWFVERAEHFLVGVIHQESPFIMESVFAVLPEVFADIEYKSIFEGITNLYVKFKNTTGLPIPYLFDAPADIRHLLLANVKDLQSLAMLSNGQFIEYFKMDKDFLEALIHRLPTLKKINMKLRCSFKVCLSWLPDQLAYIEANLPFFDKMISSRNVSIDELLSLSPEELVRAKKHLIEVILLINYKFRISRVLLLSEEQLNFICSHQRDFSRFLHHFAKSSALPLLSNEQLMLVPQYLNFVSLLKFTLEEILDYDVNKVNLIDNNYMFFYNLHTNTKINIQDFLNSDEEIISKIIKIKTVFFSLYRKDMSMSDMIKLADTHLIILEKHYEAINRWTNFNIEDINLLLQKSVEELEYFCSQQPIIDQLKNRGQLTFKEIIAIPANEREDILEIVNLYDYLKKAKKGMSFHEVMNLPKNHRKDLIKFHYQYYKMLKAGFEVNDLCPIYRIFYLEMLDFCEHITTMHALKAMDLKRFYKVMFYANAFKEYIANGHITFEQLTIFPPELLEELAKHCYHYHLILEWSGISLEEFLKIDAACREKLAQYGNAFKEYIVNGHVTFEQLTKYPPELLEELATYCDHYLQILILSGLSLEEFLKIDSVFRSKLAEHAGSFENILRNLKFYIDLSPALQSEVFEHRRAYGRLLLQSTVKLEQLLTLPDAIRYQILQHPIVFSEIIPILTIPFDEFVLSRQEDLVEFARFITENQMYLFGLMQFRFEDIMHFSVHECHQIMLSTDFYISISKELNCSIRDFYVLPLDQQNRLLKHQPEIMGCMREHHFTFNDILILDKRTGGQFYENVGVVLQTISEGRLDKDTLLQMDEAELGENLNSNFIKKPRLCCPSFM
jgi:hypothetical protein